MLSTLIFCAGVASAGTEVADKLLQGEPLGYGVGIMLGNPSGLSFAHRKSSSFVQVGLGYSIQEQIFHLSSDYLFHIKEINLNSKPRIYWSLYTGVGGEIRVVNIPQAGIGPTTGVRIPFGGAFMSSQRPFDGFIEVAPVMRVLPSTGFELSVSMGGRYYFAKKKTSRQ